MVVTSDFVGPVPKETKVVLDHLEIDTNNKKLLIFCKITDEKWLVTHMVKWKGYTIIAEIPLPNDENHVGPYTFSGTGKLSILGKNVSSDLLKPSIFCFYCFGCIVSFLLFA